MMDQAAELRQGAPPVARPRARFRCLAVGSGKGGVGKTMVSIGVACWLARLKYNVLLIDADIGLANVDLQMGVDPVFTLQDVVYGNCPIEEAVMATPHGPDLLAAASGAPELVEMGGARREMLVGELMRFASRYDFLIIDGAAGIGNSITDFLAAAPEVLVVVANEPTSIMDAYSLIKVLRQRASPPALKLVINMVRTLDEGELLARRLNDITEKFLQLPIPVAGIVTYDQIVGDAIRARQPLVSYAIRSAPAKCLADVTKFLLTSDRFGRDGQPDKASFFERLAALGGAAAGGEPPA